MLGSIFAGPYLVLIVVSFLVEVFLASKLFIPSQKSGMGERMAPTVWQIAQRRNYPPILPEVQGLRKRSAEEK